MPVTVDELNKSTTPCFTGLANKLRLTPANILRETKEIAFSDIKHHLTVDEGGAVQIIPLAKMGRRSRAIKKIKVKTIITESKDGETLYKTSTVEYELYDKLSALSEAIAIHGMKKAAKVDVTSGGQVIGFDSIPPAEREALLEISRAVQGELDANRKSK